MERRLEDADHLAIDIVDRGGGKEQPADQPAIAADPLGRRGDVPLGGIRHPLSPRFSWPVASIAPPAAAGTACAMRVFTVALPCCPSAPVRSTAGRAKGGEQVKAGCREGVGL